MGLFDWLTGNKAPDPSVPRLAADALIETLLALNDDDKPWRVVDVRGEAPGAVMAGLDALGLTHRPDLVATWKFDEARWQPDLSADGMSPGFRVLMRLDETASTVRSVDHDGGTARRADGLGASLSASRGQHVSTGFSLSFDRGADGKWSKTSQSGCSTDDIKGPLRDAVARAGWGWHGVAFGRF